MRTGLALAGALLALALIPNAAQAAPKKVLFRFSATAYSVVEGNTSFTVTVQRTGNRTPAASVQYATSNTQTSNPATPGTDYVAVAPTTLSFAPNETSKTFTVTIVDDTLVDPNETIGLALSNPSATGAPSQVKTPLSTLTIVDNDGPGTINFSSASYNVAEGAGVASVTVVRNGASNLAESVDYATSNGSATAGSDYTAASGTITFSAGEMSKTFQVPVLDDNLYEGNETVGLTLSNPQNLTLPAQPPAIGPNSPALLTILDDDVPTFSFSQPTYSVGEADGTATITVVRGGATNVAASVDYSTSGGTATAGSDYTAASGTLNFGVGETQKMFAVAINNDTASEGNETIGVQLSQSGNPVASATLSIVDNDNPLASVQLSDVGYSAGESDGSVTITVSLSHAVDGDVTVHYATSDGTATAGSPSTTDGSADYQSAGGTLTFLGNLHAPGGVGDTSETFQVPVNPDGVVEGDETFNVTLSSQTNAVLGAPSTAPVTIVDDDDSGVLELSSLRYDARENDGIATVTVNRTGGSGGAVSVDYFTSDGTASAPADYTATFGTLDFADGETQKTFEIPIAWDGVVEGDETVNIGLANPGAGADLGDNVAAVLHIADDGASDPVAFSASSYRVDEAAGSATITVTRSGSRLGGPVSVDYATSDGSATAGSDYTASSGTLTFAPGESSKTFTVLIANDSLHEDDETAGLALSNAQGGTSLGAPASATLAIADDDAAGSAPAPSGAGGVLGAVGIRPQAPAARPLTLKVTAKAVQRALKARAFVLKVVCSERCALVVAAQLGKNAKPIARATAVARGGKMLSVKLKLSKKALAALRAALAHRRAKVAIKINATGASGGGASISRVVSVRA